MQSTIRLCVCTTTLLALACATAPTAPTAPPAAPRAPTPPPAAGEPAGEKTAADPALQRDVTALIEQCEQRFGAAGRVVDTRFVRLEDLTVVESWIVSRGSSEVVYAVKLTPGASGTEIDIQCPPKPRAK